MKIQVIECKKSYVWANMWAVTYTTSKKDFFTGDEIVSEKHTMFSTVEVQPGLRTVVKEHKTVVRDGKEVELFWIKEVKE